MQAPLLSELEDVLAWLYVPAPRAGELLAKAARSADGIVLDLEDAVHPRQRAAAREHLLSALRTERVDVPLVVRVNPVDTDDFAADVEALTPLVLEGIVSAVRIAKIESAGAVARAHEIAQSEGVASIMLGEADLRADLRLPRGAAGDPGLVLARQTCVLASRAAGLPSPVGSAFTDVADADGLRATTSLLNSLGFVGRSCIHPRQSDVVREGFSPSETDLAWARAVMAEAGDQTSVDSAASVLADGSFIDPAIVRQAARLVARADAVAEVSA